MHPDEVGFSKSLEEDGLLFVRASDFIGLRQRHDSPGVV